MDKLKMHSVNKVDENIAKIGALFPNCLTERKNEDGEVELAIDFDMLKQELSSVVVEGNEERYQFTWPDKKKSILLANAPIAKTLRPCREESVDFDTTENLYIEGDNLDVLKLLQETYLGKIKMIYIDPPYNTGNDFVYNDDFLLSVSEYVANSGQLDELGNQLVHNTETNGRFHTDWLNMLYPRLKIAKNLLTDDGAIFISIDENEVSTLKMICDEIFGRSNFVAELIWAAGRKNDSKHISVSHEYILCYFRNIEYIKEHKLIWREKKQGLDAIYAQYDLLKTTHRNDCTAIEKELKKWYKNLPDGHPAADHSHYNKVDNNGIFFASDISWPGGGGPKYQILHPVTKKPVKIPSRGWITNQDTMKAWIEQGKVHFGVDEKAVPTVKSYLRDHELGVPYSVFYQDGRAASKRLATLMGEKVFENPKDEDIIKRIIEFCGVGENDYVLDFFSGSATTAHAMFLANLEQNINRRFILVQLPEEISEKNVASEKSKKVAKSAIALCDELQVPHNICEIGKERIRRAGAKIKADSPLTTQNLDTGFRVLKLDSSNMKDVYYSKRIKIVGWANGAHINNGYNFLVTIQNRCLSPLLIKRVSLILDKEVEVVLFQSFTLMDGKDSVEIRTVDPFKTETFVSNGSTLPLLERGSLDKYKHIMFCFTFSDGSETKIRYKLKPIKEKKYRTLVPKQFVIKDIPVTDHMKYIVEYRNSDGVSSTHIVYRNGRLKEAIGNVDTIPKGHLQSADILKQFLETTIRDSTFEVHTNQHCKQG